MPYSSNGETVIYFCHVPKTGGRSIERWMQEYFGNLSMMDPDWTDYWKRGGWRKRGIGTSRQHMDWATAVTQLDCQPDYVFAIVREPVSRLKSEYRFQSRHRRKRRALAAMGFSRWCRIMFVASRIYPSVFDNHFRAQSDIVPEHANLFSFEAGLEAVTCWLSDVSPSGQERPELRGPEQHDGSTKIAVTPADAVLIEHWYKDDYARFDFPRSANGPMGSIALRDRLLGLLVAIAFRLGRL